MSYPWNRDHPPQFAVCGSNGSSQGRNIDRSDNESVGSGDTAVDGPVRSPWIPGQGSLLSEANVNAFNAEQEILFHEHCDRSKYVLKPSPEAPTLHHPSVTVLASLSQARPIGHGDSNTAVNVKTLDDDEPALNSWATHIGPERRGERLELPSIAPLSDLTLELLRNRKPIGKGDPLTSANLDALNETQMKLRPEPIFQRLRFRAQNTSTLCEHPNSGMGDGVGKGLEKVEQVKEQVKDEVKEEVKDEVKEPEEEPEEANYWDVIGS